jgi:hypothetical protein
VSDVTTRSEPAPPGHEEAIAFLERAAGGDASTLPTLRRMLLQPGAADLLGGDLARRAEEALVSAAAGNDLLFTEALTRKLDLLRADLAGPGPTPLEKLLVDRVVICWLQVHQAGLRLARHEREMPPAQAEYHQRARDRAHRRFLSAVRTLALVRRLALPVLVQQINVAAKQQVNVAR